MTHPNVKTFMELSTAHLSPETLINLEAMPNQELPFSGGPTQGGWFCYANDENDGSIADDIWDCMVYAKSHGVDYIKWDCDGYEADDLKTYDHGILADSPEDAEDNDKGN